MTLHVFNPEHDLALAANLEHFTAPLAARRLGRDLGFLPMLWAGADGCVLVEDAELADLSFQQLVLSAAECLGVSLGREGCWHAGRSLPNGVDGVMAWGWDAALRFRLRQLGIADGVLPGDARLCQMRDLSHRRTAARLLGLLRDDCPCITIGDIPAECFTVGEAEAAVVRFRRSVVKAPWSSSGRGVRFVRVDGGCSPLLCDASLQGWLRNVICRQGSVMVEPLYDKVEDFGMEFEARPDGSVVCCGLSLFHTVGGAYTGNVLATEQVKRALMGRYVPAEALERIRESICRRLPSILQGCYCGPLGIDMMVCRPGSGAEKERANEGSGLLIHPCVELNLRCTMGHVALALTPASDERQGVMQIVVPSPECPSPHYRMTISKSAPPLRARS